MLRQTEARLPRDIEAIPIETQLLFSVRIEMQLEFDSQIQIVTSQ